MFCELAKLERQRAVFVLREGEESQRCDKRFGLKGGGDMSPRSMERKTAVRWKLSWPILAVIVRERS